MKTTPHLAPPQRLQPNKVRILLCGYGHLGLALLDGLLACADSCEIVGVFRWSARPDSQRYWEPIEADFQQRVKAAKLNELQCNGMNSYDFITQLETLQPDVVLVGSWGEILQPHLLTDSAPLMINCHPSKLPAHRGANPYSSVIRTGEAETGVTFHHMAAQIDAGPILLQRPLPLDVDETGDSVRQKCAQTAQDMVPELVQLLHQHVAEGVPLPQQAQDPAQKSYFPQLKAEDGSIQWEASNDELSRQLRGLFPWIACYGVLENHRTVLFYDPRIIALDPQTVKPKPHPLPGTILSNLRGVIRIALANPQMVLEVSQYQFGKPGLNFYWPLWLSQYQSPFILRPGLRFISHHA